MPKICSKLDSFRGLHPLEPHTNNNYKITYLITYWRWLAAARDVLRPPNLADLPTPMVTLTLLNEVLEL